MSISQTNIVTKHGKNSYLKILNQDKSINTIKMSNILNKYINEAQKESLLESSINMINQYNQHANVPSENSGTLNVQSRDRYPLIDSSNATFASS